ncbi:uncharacterized protein LOC110252581 [Exaiptasia diaphana]|uniref:Uncharacterized protein n=1 Tax=Exaiptasia diaphana TaxID=2652724 RepID=A0A913Y5E8_EXADI|nr:uncharacterized protein LOC110252581 [Exaiptasia diaphana]KXJ22410.1 Acyl-CoA synthetase family member 2, mitochondrial [Exaiptasia diaphana]
MSYVHKPHTKPLEHRTPFQLLDAHANAHPKKEAFVFRDETKNRTSLTFQEYESNSRLLAAALLEIGLVRGDRVLLMLPSCIEFVIVHMALNRIGANVLIVEEDAYPAVLGVVDLACVIARNEIECPSANHDQVLENIQKIASESLKAVLIVSPSAGPLQDFENVFIYKELFQMAEAMVNWNEAVRRAEAAVQMDDPSFVVFTSGSTSIPKPIQYTNHGFVNGVLADASLMLMDENSIYFSDAPFDWVSGLCFSIGVVITMGSTLVVFPPKLTFEGRLVPTVMKIIEEEECTHAMILAYFFHDITMCNEILDMNLSKLKVAITGGQAATLSLMRTVFDRIPHLIINNIYGGTEMNMIANKLITRENLDTMDPGLMEIVEGCEVKIVEENRNLAPLMTKGELCVRASWVSFPMWDLLLSPEGKPTNTQTDAAKNGWHYTNDGASLDENGKLRLQGRMDDMIKCATESIPPYEIESLLLDHPCVHKVCVVGIPDERLYEKMCACVILKDGSDENDHLTMKDELDKYCSENCWLSTVGLFWKPHYYIFVKEFPMTRTGKLSRKLTKEMAIKNFEL